MDNLCNILSLPDLCLLAVSNYLSPSNVWFIYRIVPCVHCKRIEHIVHSFICDNFMDISHARQFLDLDEKEMQWIVDNDEIMVSEAAVLDGLARWYKHSEVQRESSFKRLFDRLHLSVIGRDVLWQIIKKYELHKVIPDLRKYKVLKFPPSRRLSDSVDEMIHEENISTIFLFEKAYCGFTCFTDTSLDLFWSPFSSRYSKHKYFHSCVGSAGSCEYQYAIPFREKVFALGMMKQKSGEYYIVPVNIRLDFHPQNITQCTPLHHVVTLENHYIDPLTLYVVCGTFIYFLGGHRCEVHKDTVYRYDTVEDKWREMSRMTYCHSTIGSTVIAYKNKYLYVFSKHGSEKYNMSTNTWFPIEFPTKEYRFGDHHDERWSPFIMNEKIYVPSLLNLNEPSDVCIVVYDSQNETSQEMVLPYEVYSIWCAPQEFFGEIFSTIHNNSKSKEVRKLFVVDEYLTKKKVCSKKVKISGKSKMLILNRRACRYLYKK